ncbi:MAG: hypothetical protein GY748_16465 [Planctomycetaceae bacterium]|nr:hypothetical protein [Planctomycetaceae bacterium]
MWIGTKNANLVMPVETVAKRLDQGFRQIESSRIHLCPLDCADDLPTMKFGVNTIQKLSPDELETFIDSRRLVRTNSSWIIDKIRFSKFNWLIVEERVLHDVKSGARVISDFFGSIDLSRDFGEIIPHKEKFPVAVENALFALLLLPWEELTSYGDFDWRGFRVPWVYTVDDDIFKRPAPPPSSDTLSWEPKIFSDQYGHAVELEVPVCLPLQNSANEKLRRLNDTTWSDLLRALDSPLFATPIKHFLVRAFLSDDIDEFLAHITVIEAALGLKIDFDAGSRPKIAQNKNPGATFRVATRLSRLLGRQSAAKEFQTLFKKRSEYLHGRKMIAIPSNNKILARRLARETVEHLMMAALTIPSHKSRNKYLADLLKTGLL